ncbi:MAG TPA: DMT family transporter [Candidatus Saccharimonadales bacterium]|nr:DMT family transporter [Candidatus Saccharimonadales bacterium]
MFVIFLAVLVLILWGTGDVFGTGLTRKMGGIKTAFWFYLALVPFYTVVCIFFAPSISVLTPGLVLFNLLLGVVGLSSMLTFYQGLRVGNASIVSTIAASFIWITVIFSLIFFHEKINTYQVLAIIVILSGIVISSLNLQEIKKGKSKLGKDVIYGLATMVLWGIFWTFIKIPIQQMGWAYPNLITVLPAVPLAVVFTLLKKVKLEFSDLKKYHKLIIADTLFLGTGSFVYSVAIQSGAQLSIITPIANSYPILLAILLYKVYKDPITKQQIIGIGTTIAGIILLSALSA